MPAIGMITEFDRFCIKLKILPFHPCGVCPTWEAISPVFSLTSVNIVVRLDVTIPVRRSLIQFSIASMILSNINESPFLYVRTILPAKE